MLTPNFLLLCPYSIYWEIKDSQSYLSFFFLIYVQFEMQEFEVGSFTWEQFSINEAKTLVLTGKSLDKKLKVKEEPEQQSKSSKQKLEEGTPLSSGI